MSLQPVLASPSDKPLSDTAAQALEEYVCLSKYFDSVRQLHKATGLSFQTISKHLKRKSQASEETLQRLQIFREACEQLERQGIPRDQVADWIMETLPLKDSRKCMNHKGPDWKRGSKLIVFIWEHESVSDIPFGKFTRYPEMATDLLNYLIAKINVDWIEIEKRADNLYKLSL